MNELPLSKFAPFTKEEAIYQHEVSNKLKDINVKCSNCIYLGNLLPIKTKEDSDTLLDNNNNNNLTLYKCNILSECYEGDTVSSNGLCRFFTNKEEVDTPAEEDYDPTTIEANDQELSQQLNNIDFNNINSIAILRNSLINDN